MRTSAKPKPEAAPIQHANQSNTGPEFEIPLDQLKQIPEDYQHRDQEDLVAKKAAMKALMDSLQSEGLQEPLIVYKDPTSGAYVQITGHRRRAAIEALADANVGNFKRDMPVKVREVLNGSRADYLLLSVMDNVIREQLDEYQKICAAIRFINEGIDHPRIKYSLNLSDTAFDRVKRLAANPWMFEHVKQTEIGMTDAHLLLEAAGGKGGQAAVEYLKKDLAREIALVNVKIAQKRADAVSRDKDLRPADAVVKNYFPPHQIRTWVQALKRGEHIPLETNFLYGACMVADQSGKRLVIPGITIRLVETELERLGEIYLKLNQLLKHAAPEINALALQRKALDKRVDKTGPADYKSAGLDALADYYATGQDTTDTQRDEATTQADTGYDSTPPPRETTPTQSQFKVSDTQPALVREYQQPVAGNGAGTK